MGKHKRLKRACDWVDEDFKIGPKKDFAVTGLALDQIMEVDGTQND